jgi:hypothetical protein
MTAPDTGWLRGNPATLLDRRAVLPGTFAALLDAGPDWRLLYEQWLAEHHDVAVPNFEKQAVVHVYDRLADPGHERDVLDEAFARQFSASYQRFHDACRTIRADLTGRVDTLVADGGDRQEAAASVGAAVAVAAVGTAVAAVTTGAGGTPPDTLKAWTAAEAGKAGLADAYKALEKALADKYFTGRHAEHATSVTAAAWKALQARADDVRAVVAGFEKGPGDETALRAAIAAWACAVQDAATAAGVAAGRLSEWTRENRDRIVRSDFRAVFAAVGAVFEGGHGLVGGLGDAAARFESLAFLTGTLGAAHDTIDRSARLIVADFQARDDRTRQRLSSSTRFAPSERFHTSVAGRVYAARQGLKADAKRLFQRRYPQLLANPASAMDFIRKKVGEKPAAQGKALPVGTRDRVTETLGRLRRLTLARMTATDGRTDVEAGFDELTDLFDRLGARGQDEETLSRVRDALGRLVAALAEDLRAPAFLAMVGAGFRELLGPLPPGIADRLTGLLPAAAPYDETAAVLAAARRDHPDGLTYGYTTLVPAWDSVRWSEARHGVLSATVRATSGELTHTLTLAITADGPAVGVTVAAVDPEPAPPDLVAEQLASADEHAGEPAPVAILVDLVAGVVTGGP